MIDNSKFYLVMKIKNTLLFVLLLLSSYSLTAQMQVGTDTLYGNEWINYEQKYYKIPVGDDGIYRISYQDLNDAGILSGTDAPKGENFKLLHLGQEIPLYVTTDGSIGSSDYIEFFGDREKGYVDKFLFVDDDHHLNPKYSMFTDTASYFLTWNADTNHKRISSASNDLNDLPPVEEYVWYHQELALRNKHQWGALRTGGGNSLSCQYDLGEGYGEKRYKVRHEYNLSGSQVFGTGPSTKLSIRFATNQTNHDINIVFNDVTYDNITTSGWNILESHIEVPTSSVTSGTNKFKIVGTLDEDKILPSVINFEYPRRLHFSNRSYLRFSVDASEVKKYFVVQKFTTDGVNPILYDLTNNLRIEAFYNPSIDRVEFTLPPSTQKRDLVIVNPNSINPIPEINKKNFINFNDIELADYLIVSHQNLMVGANWVQEYADYRASPQGGNFTPIVVDVNQIYDQFGYGIERHEMSMRNFTHYAIKNWEAKYLFLIGKGVNYVFMRDNPEAWRGLSLVPSFGTPQSDHLFATGNDNNIPKIPVGRLSAKNAGQVQLYLNKVKEYEAQLLNTPQTIEDKQWMKQILHLAGGDAVIQPLIRSELAYLESIIESNTFGADVKTFYKTSTDPVQVAQSEQLIQSVNDGVSLISFFGHSAASTLDFDLGDPADYDNKGRYPLMYAIGCHTNRMFESTSTLAEDWVLIPDKGAIIFLGATFETTLSNLSSYAKFMYTNLSEARYGDRFGDIMRQTILDFSIVGQAFYSEQLKQVLIIHGDPAISINPHPAPDYLIDGTQTRVNPTLLNVAQTEFDLNYTVTNLGRNVTDSIVVRIDQELPNGEIINIKQEKILAPSYEVDITTVLPVVDNTAIGLNKIHINIDSNNDIDELPNPIAENNNSYSIPFYIVADDVEPLAPDDFGIVSNPNFELKASSTNTFAEELSYYFEIDTTEKFNSPIRKGTIITQTGGLLKWQPNIQAMNNTVYYWRSSVDSTKTLGNGFKWNQSSFLYLDGSSPGWNQSHFYQQLKNEMNTMHIPEDTRKISYADDIRNLVVYAGNSAYHPAQDLAVFMNNSLLDFWWFNQPGLAFMVLDPISLEPWINYSPGLYGSIYSSIQIPHVLFSFPTTIQSGRQNAINFIENVVPDDHIVLVYTITNGAADYRPDLWAADSISLGTNLFQVLENQGATQIRNTVDRRTPYIFLFQKGNLGYVDGGEIHGEQGGIILTEGNFTLTGRWNTGDIYSTTIGPAKNWGSFLWELEDYDANSDRIYVDIFGLNDDDESTLLYQLNPSQADFSLENVDATQYPRLKLEYHSRDSAFRTNPHMKYWRVLYDPIPEAALAPNEHFVFVKDTLDEGQPLHIEFALENVSRSNMDSLLIRYAITDQTNQQIINDVRIAPLLMETSIIANIDLSTRGLVGDNQIVIDVNPDDDQPELTHINNVAFREFHVVPDRKNPLLDVTFDGVHIMDGDIVSAKPYIIISLLDDNQYLPLDDTSLFKILVKPPNTEQLVEYYIDDNILTFHPASPNGENKAWLEFRPHFDVDGDDYQLFIQAQDVSGNKSGDIAYKVNFEVINQTSVSNVLNYPNPFSTSTQFVFTLTGDKLPDYMKIQIMTVAGKVVREITMDELGPIKIGNNLTEFRWDGTDEFGDKLANGVYLYRVVTRGDDQDYEKYDKPQTDQYFKNGFGKMMILR